MRPHKQSILLVCLWVALSGATNAEESPLQIVNWTAAGTTIVRFSFGKFKELSSSGKQHVYATEVTAQNLWTKPISRATFTLYVFD